MWQPMEMENVPLRAEKEEEPPPPPPSGSSPRWKFRFIACGVFVVAAALVAAVIAIKATEPDPLEQGPCVSECPRCRKGVRHPPAQELPTPQLTEPRGSDPWVITSNIKSLHALSYDPSDDSLRVDYRPGKWGAKSGAEFKANPGHAFPADSAVMSYQVYFPEDFPWTRGGKLPGFCIGASYGECATGSHWAWGSGSLRLMWREGGRAIGYSYIPLQAGLVRSRWAAWRLQGGSYKGIASTTGNTGDDLWCKVDGGLQLRAGEWNDVSLVVAMNTPGIANGWVSITVNGETRTVKGVRWRGWLSKKMRVSAVVFASFFGGGDETWAAPAKTYAKFRNFRVSAPADLGASNI